jgi:hypothetical protein
MKICPKCKSSYYANKCECGYKPNLSVVKETPHTPSYGNKCSIAGCNQDWTERFNGYSILMCRKHADDLYLKTNINQFVEVEILMSRKFKEEAKTKGMSNLEYFEFCNPPGKNAYTDLVTKKFIPVDKKTADEKTREFLRGLGTLPPAEYDNYAAQHQEKQKNPENLSKMAEIDFIGYEEMFK